MAYQKLPLVHRNRLVSRQQPSDLSGIDEFWRKLKTGVKGAINFYGEQQRAAGAAAAQTAPQPVYAQPGGISTNTLLIAGGVGVLALVLLRRKS